jgi:NAD(P)H-dependent FMN reductase
MSKLTVICGSNRKESNSSIISSYISSNLKDINKVTVFLNLYDLNSKIELEHMYFNSDESFEQLKKELIAGSDKFIFVIPEYNGSFPGVLKLFVDTVPPEYWKGKKAGLVGLSSGMQGGALAMSQFTNVLNYLKCSVYYHKPKIPLIESKIENGLLVNMDEMEKIDSFLKGFVEF